MIYQAKQRTDQSLSLPVSVKHRWSKYFTPAVLTLALLVVYLSTICPTVYLGDSGELSAAAFCLGIPHNSGYTLYRLLGKLFSLIPVGNTYEHALNIFRTVDNGATLFLDGDNNIFPVT